MAGYHELDFIGPCTSGWRMGELTLPPPVGGARSSVFGLQSLTDTIGHELVWQHYAFAFDLHL